MSELKGIISKDEKIHFLRNNGQGGLCEVWALLDGIHYPGRSSQNWTAALTAMQEVRGSKMKYLLSPASKNIVKLWTDALLKQMDLYRKTLRKVFPLNVLFVYFIFHDLMFLIILVSTGGVVE